MLDALQSRVTNRLLTRFPGPGIEVPTDTPVVSFTFDDVPDTALSEGAAILEHHDARGTFYIAGGMLGLHEPQRRLIDATGCAALARRGHELGCHTFAHLNTQKTSSAVLEADLARNAMVLDAAVPGITLRNFAFPYNAATFRHRRALAQRYRSARGGIAGINRGRTDRSFLRSLPLQQPEQSVLDMRAQIDALVAAPGWLIFFAHDLANRPTPYGCTAKSFADLVAHARTSGCTILTVDAALDRFGAPA